MSGCLPSVRAMPDLDAALAQMLVDGCGLCFHDMKEETRIVASQPLR